MGLEGDQTSHVGSPEVDQRFSLEVGLEIGQTSHLRSQEVDTLRPREEKKTV